jgi:hypothetical protein
MRPARSSRSVQLMAGDSGRDAGGGLNGSAICNFRRFSRSKCAIREPPCALIAIRALRRLEQRPSLARFAAVVSCWHDFAAIGAAIDGSDFVGFAFHSAIQIS